MLVESSPKGVPLWGNNHLRILVSFRRSEWQPEASNTKPNTAHTNTKTPGPAARRRGRKAKQKPRPQPPKHKRTKAHTHTRQLHKNYQIRANSISKKGSNMTAKVMHQKRPGETPSKHEKSCWRLHGSTICTYCIAQEKTRKRIPLCEKNNALAIKRCSN